MRPPQNNDVALCIPTFRRPELLAELLNDLSRQSVQPGFVIVVDGDSGSGEVLRVLQGYGTEFGLPIRYAPSNHGNLAYQRYLGWRDAASEGCQILVYLDDDLRISDRHSLEHLIAPMLSSSSEVVGCTGEIRFGDLQKIGEEELSVRDRHEFSQKPRPSLVKLFGSSRGLHPGELTASGHRCPPDRSAGLQVPVHWLRGGVMAYRMSALDEDCFSTTLFAIYETRCGRGEDTLLSRRVASRGRLVMVFDAVFEHPNMDAPKAYATKAFRMGEATAYSRRLLNDNYRWPAAPTLADRLALWKSYAGNTMLDVFRALRSPKAHRFVYAWGYFCGAFKGVFLPPSHKRLTPHIDWQNDAAAALSQCVNLTAKS